MFSGGGVGYSSLNVQQGTVLVGANNGIATTATVSISNVSGGTGILDLNGFNQTLEGITKGTGSTAIIGNSSTTADSTLTTTGTSTFAGGIQNVIGSGTKKISLTVNGGALTLTGANTYGGNTTVSAGTLTLGNAPSPLNANTGNDASIVTIAATGAALNLTYTGTDTVDKLFIGSTQMASGVYGRSGSVSPIIGISQITGGGTLTVTSSPVFTAWITGSFINGQVPLNKQGPNDDPDNDGIRNLLEYAIAGHDPTVSNATVGTFSGNTLSFTKRTGTTGLTYAIQKSTDLGIGNAWTEVSGGAYVNSTTIISYTFTPGTPARNFLRLRVVSN